jgi:hypothetical protein
MRLPIPLVLTALVSGHLSAAHAQGAPSAEAQRHLDRGTAALEMGDSRSDLAAAVKEFGEAVRLAPEWPDAHCGLGSAREKAGDLGGAQASLERCLALNPGAPDAAALRTRINKLEFRRERLDEQARVTASLTGTWRGFMNFCGGNRRELRIVALEDGRLAVEMTTGWNADAASDFDVQTIPARWDGEELAFSFTCQFLAPKIKLSSRHPVEYRLRLARPGVLEGTIRQANNAGRPVQLAKQ